ncbi:MAG: putative sulfate exporter family transporter [Candidatus Methanomethylicaceae archaeon]
MKKNVTSEDWWSVILGFFILALASLGIIFWTPKIKSWTLNPLEAIGLMDLNNIILTAIFLLFIITITIVTKGRRVLLQYIVGFSFLFILAFLAILISEQTTLKNLGLEYVIWALLLGLLVNGIIGIPNWLKNAIRTELYIKIGLVLLGAEILFQQILSAGFRGIIQALLVVFIVWYFCYFLALKFKLNKSLACIMATGVSICGVSAAIAAGGAIKGNPKEVGYVISVILLIALPMVIIMPFMARALSLNDAVAGAWIGGTIDTTPAVVAAGELYSSEAMKYAAIVKMSQNALIGFAAFLLALYWTFKIEKKNGKPKLIEIWYKFPKFIIGFILASLFFSFLIMPIVGSNAVNAILSITKGFRAWFFTLAFTCIGLEIKLSEWISIGHGKPLLVFLIAQTFNIFLTLALASILFGSEF